MTADPYAVGKAAGAPCVVCDGAEETRYSAAAPYTEPAFTHPDTGLEVPERTYEAHEYAVGPACYAAQRKAAYGDRVDDDGFAVQEG